MNNKLTFLLLCWPLFTPHIVGTKLVTEPVTTKVSVEQAPPSGTPVAAKVVVPSHSCEFAVPFKLNDSKSNLWIE